MEIKQHEDLDENHGIVFMNFITDLQPNVTFGISDSRSFPI